jgi:hypothetical protein
VLVSDRGTPMSFAKIGIIAFIAFRSRSHLTIPLLHGHDIILRHKLFWPLTTAQHELSLPSAL